MSTNTAYKSLGKIRLAEKKIAVIYAENAFVMWNGSVHICIFCVIMISELKWS